MALSFPFGFNSGNQMIENLLLEIILNSPDSFLQLK